MAARDNERMVFFSQQRVKSLTDTSVFRWMTGQPEALISGGGQYTHEYSNTNSSYIIYRLALVSNNRLVSVIYQYKPQSRPLCQQTKLISPRNHLTVKVLSAQIEEVNTLKP